MGVFDDMDRYRKKQARQREQHFTERRKEGRAQSSRPIRSEDIKSRYGEDESGGYTDTYFGGIDTPDGPGHGHIRLNEGGEATIIRDAYEPGEPNARRDAIIKDTRS